MSLRLLTAEGGHGAPARHELLRGRSLVPGAIVRPDDRVHLVERDDRAGVLLLMASDERKLPWAQPVAA